MYLGKREIFNLAEYNKRRLECLKYKKDATFTAFSELEDLINKTQFAKQYFEKSHAWLSQRLNGYMVQNKSQKFKEEEYHEITEAFRHIAKRLNVHADEIDAAVMFEE